MRNVVTLVLGLLFAVSLAAGDAAVIVPGEQVKLAPATSRHASIGQTTIPNLLGYDGEVLDSMGSPVPDGAWPVLFALYTEPAGGTPYWIANKPVETRDGLFHVLLGSSNPMPSVPEFGTSSSA